MISYIVYFFGFFLSVFFWQYTAKRNDWVFKPTYFIDLVTDQINTIYNWLGKVVVWISSFYTFFDFKDLAETFEELYVSIRDLLFSWKTFVNSYVSNMSFYDHPYLISLGSITLVGLALYLVYTFRNLYFFRIITDFVSEKVTQINDYFSAERQNVPESSYDDCSAKAKPKSTRRTVRNS